ncbi:MAG: DUF4158 domain-containing protein [Mesorhizobium sp.]|nr:MAG: DUF4158 domain-containing protein [Mesorhizobium sp.]
MGRRRLVNAAEAKVLFGLPADEDSLLRHYTLDPIDRLECEVRRRPHNKLGFGVQLCVMRHTGRLLGEDEQPHATVIRYLADQLGVDSQDYAIYARRVQTRFEHSRFLTEHLSLHIANKNDRRAALLAAIDAGAAGDKGYPRYGTGQRIFEPAPRPRARAQDYGRPPARARRRASSHAPRRSYFGSIPHAELSVARRIVDRRVLHLLKMWQEMPGRRNR